MDEASGTHDAVMTISVLEILCGTSSGWVCGVKGETTMKISLCCPLMRTAGQRVRNAQTLVH